MPDQEKQWFEIVKYNHMTKESAVVTTVRGISQANQKVNNYDERRTSEEKESGVYHHHQPCSKPSGAKKLRKPPNKRPHRRR
jgi:hypothetical protein